MKNTKILAAVFCTLSLVAAGGTVLINSHNNVNEVANAATSTTIYFTPDSVWAQASATFRVGTSNSFDSAHKMTAVNSTFKSSLANYSGNTIYSYTFSGSVSDVYFFRASSDGNTKWNSSNKVTRPSDQYYFIKRDDWWDTWTQDQGTWNNTDTIYTTAQQTAGSNTGRVFLHNSGTSWSWDGAVSVRAWGGDAASRNNLTTTASIYNLSWIQDDTGTYYGYADIPTNVTGYQFVLMSGSGTGKDVWNYQKNSAFTPNKESFSCVHYCGDYTKENMSITLGGAKDGHAGATLLTKVYEAHYTCSSNIYNGYPTVDHLNNHFYSHALDGAVNTTIDTSYTIKHKHEKMTSLNVAASSSLKQMQFNNTSTVGFVLVIVPVTLISAIGLSILLKKKYSK